MMHSDNQLIRILTIVLILGAVLFIFFAEMSHLDFKQTVTSAETIYIQGDGEISKQDNEPVTEYEEVISTEIDIAQTEDISNKSWADSSADNTNLKQVLDFEHITLLVANMNKNERERVLSNQDLFKLTH